MSVYLHILIEGGMFLINSLLWFACRNDLLYEWLFEIRGKIFLSEYVIVWATFIAIQVVGMDAGIVIGVLVAIIDHTIHSSKTLNVYRVSKKSRVVRTPEEQRILQYQGYNFQAPKIVTLEVAGSVFFGSSLGLLHRMTEELGLDMNDSAITRTPPVFKSPHTPSFLLIKERRGSVFTSKKEVARALVTPPKYLVVDLTRLNNLDGKIYDACCRVTLHLSSYTNEANNALVCLLSIRLSRLLFAACKNVAQERDNSVVCSECTYVLLHFSHRI